MYRTSAFIVAVATAAMLVPSVASACDMAEKLRLGEEQKKLASRNAWSGVERSYEALLETKCDLAYDQHFLGAESARVLGKTWEQYVRLESAVKFEENAEVRAQMDAIEADYGRVEIQGDPRRRPTFSRPEMPFAPDQRKSVEWAETVIANTGSFYGMLPVGDYLVADENLTVAAGSPDFQVVSVGKVRKSPSGGGNTGGASDNAVSTIRYANVVATIGPNLMVTSVGKINTLNDGGDQFVPAPITGSGVAAQIGGELGLSYAEPALGVAAVLGYAGGYGSDTVHSAQIWLAGVLRPGELRIALGPQYVYLGATGTGISDQVKRGGAAPQNVQFGGRAWGPGAQTSIGYGLLDFDKLRGVVELGGSWHSDGARSYFGAGLRVGIVPTVPRFKG